MCSDNSVLLQNGGSVKLSEQSMCSDIGIVLDGIPSARRRRSEADQRYHDALRVVIESHLCALSTEDLLGINSRTEGGLV